MAIVRRGLIGAVVTTASVALAGSWWAAPAEAAPAAPVAITCGAVLRQDAYLAADLSCPTGNGVTAAASLSIDLRGHHLTGSSGGVGITVDYPATVKVTHGRLTGWGTGLTTVLTNPARPSVLPSITVIAVTFLDNGTGIAQGDLGADDSDVDHPITYTVYRSWFVANGAGIGGPIGYVGMEVSGSTFRYNQVAVSQNGYAETNIGYITVADSELSKNQVGVYCHSSECDLQRNSFSANPTAVRSTYNYTNVVMTGNTVTGSTIAVDVQTNYVSMVGNIFTGNTTAVSYDYGSGSVRDNVFSGNGKALAMTDVGFEDCGVCPPIPVSGNRVANNTGNGIVISNSNVSLKDNISTFNHGWGIDAPGAVDAGGNRAFGNYHSPQCVGVVCTH